MPIWIAKLTVLATVVAMVAIRAPHGQRSRSVGVARSYKGPLEVTLLTLAWLAFLLPLLWLATPWLAFAEYALHPAALTLGVLLILPGLWLLHRSHVDLGSNWSITLELRENHSLVTEGVYRRIRHPMYTALFLQSFGLALVLPNWVAGPAYLIAFTLLYALRVKAEEQMMREAFGETYAAYTARTTRLLPGLW